VATKGGYYPGLSAITALSEGGRRSTTLAGTGTACCNELADLRRRHNNQQVREHVPTASVFCAASTRSSASKIRLTWSRRRPGCASAKASEEAPTSGGQTAREQLRLAEGPTSRRGAT